MGERTLFAAVLLACISAPLVHTQPPPGAAGARLEGDWVRIDPDGVVRRVTLVEESAAGFGGACTRTLTGSRWAAPKDKAGRSVATEIRYTCRFVVQP